jgi:putative isomerase
MLGRNLCWRPFNCSSQKLSSHLYACHLAKIGRLAWMQLALLCLGLMAHAAEGPYAYTGAIQLDLQQTPFSRFGSYLSISELSRYPEPLRRQGLFLRTLHGGGVNVFELQLMQNGSTVPFRTTATPTKLKLASDTGYVEICFQGPRRLRVRGKGVGLRLSAREGAWAVPYPASRWEVNTSEMKYTLWPLAGLLDKDMKRGEDGHSNLTMTFGAALNSDIFEAEIDAYTSAWQSHKTEGTFDEAEKGEREEYNAWLKKMPEVGATFGRGAEVAAYASWESVVEPSGNLKRPTMLMSKNWMSSVWSWDQTFNSMAMALKDPELSWDQFMLPIDVQDEDGAFPDKWDADTMAWEFSKPPVHGWALAWMLRHHRFEDRTHLQQVYKPLVKWTNWYFRYRDSDGNGLPEYRHGNESGWDNSTVMRNDGPFESPDLSAYLVLQMETLSMIAEQLGKPADAREWKARSEHLLQAMLARFWRNDRFVAFRASDGSEIDSDSLLLSMPIILGHRLPANVRDQMLKPLASKSAYLTQFGLASEPPSSSYYTPDGYWRGPIWAPSPMIIAEGLDDAGEHEFARFLREEFCRMAQENGMAENFNALIGEALRDPAYTWTSSVYLIFANQLYSDSQRISTGK